jgi:hypothetical protein
MDQGACWETSNHSAIEEVPRLCVDQNPLPCLHVSVFIRIYWAILIHCTLLHPISLIQILIQHYTAKHMVSFARVLIDNLNKPSIIVFLITRFCFVASVFFNILINEKLWQLSVWLEFITWKRRSDAAGNFGQSVLTDAWRMKNCNKTTFNDPSINVFSCSGRTLQKFCITAPAGDILSHLTSSWIFMQSWVCVSYLLRWSKRLIT